MTRKNMNRLSADGSNTAKHNRPSKFLEERRNVVIGLIGAATLPTVITLYEIFSHVTNPNTGHKIDPAEALRNELTQKEALLYSSIGPAFNNNNIEGVKEPVNRVIGGQIVSGETLIIFPKESTIGPVATRYYLEVFPKPNQDGTPSGPIARVGVVEQVLNSDNKTWDLIRETYIENTADGNKALYHGQVDDLVHPSHGLSHVITTKNPTVMTTGIDTDTPSATYRPVQLPPGQVQADYTGALQVITAAMRYEPIGRHFAPAELTPPVNV